MRANVTARSAGPGGSTGADPKGLPTEGTPATADG